MENRMEQDANLSWSWLDITQLVSLLFVLYLAYSGVSYILLLKGFGEYTSVLHAPWYQLEKYMDRNLHDMN